jgi:RNA polymerase sigma factor (sigma-70 family)
MIIKEQEDTILIQNILDGNQIAQKTLYEKYKRIVKNFIKIKYSIIYDLDDDVSEIMIKIFLNLKEFNQTKSKFKSWVFSITNNYMIDKWRCNTISLTSLDNPLTISDNCIDLSDNYNEIITTNNIALVANCSYTLSNVTDFENCNSIDYISNQLSPVDYTLLDMKYVQGYKYCEIGKEFNLTSNTISNRVNYIKTKLKKNNSKIICE